MKEVNSYRTRTDSANSLKKLCKESRQKKMKSEMSFNNSNNKACFMSQQKLTCEISKKYAKIKQKNCLMCPEG